MQAKIRQGAIIKVPQRPQGLAVQAVIVDALEEVAHSGADLKGEGRVRGSGVMCECHGLYSSCTEVRSVAFVGLKITRCCTCTIPEFLNAAMQQMHMHY